MRRIGMVSLLLLLWAGPARAQQTPRSPFDAPLGEDAPASQDLIPRFSTPEPRTSLADLLEPMTWPTWQDDGARCRTPDELRLLTWNVGTVVPHSLSPWSLRLMRDREALVVFEARYQSAEVVTLQEVQDQAQIERLVAALREKSGYAFQFVTTRVDERRADGRMIATLYRRPARKVLQFHSQRSGFNAHAVVFERCTVINVHGPSVSYEHRQQFYGDLIRWSKTLPGPLVLAGDFNLGPERGAGSAAVMPEGLGIREADQATFRSLEQAFPVQTRAKVTTVYWLLLDHVMASEGQLTWEETVPTLVDLPMDHYPMAVTLDLDPSTRKQRRGFAHVLWGSALPPRDD